MSRMLQCCPWNKHPTDAVHYSTDGQGQGQGAQGALMLNITSSLGHLDPAQKPTSVNVSHFLPPPHKADRG